MLSSERDTPLYTQSYHSAQLQVIPNVSQTAVTHTIITQSCQATAEQNQHSL